MCNLALQAVRTVTFDAGGKKEVDIKRYARVEKIPGGEIEDSTVLDGVMLNKDITHPKMRRRIENPRIVLLDCPLEYKKGESQTNIEISKEEDWNRILQIEEEQVKLMCDAIVAVKPDLVITEKGVSGKFWYSNRVHLRLPNKLQTSHNISLSRTTSPLFVASGKRTITVSLVLQARPSLTPFSLSRLQMLARTAGCSKSLKLAMSTSPS